MAMTDQSVSRILRKHYALPAEHGSWIWWIGPFLIGAAAGGRLDGNLLILFIAALAAFLSRQPTTMVVKVLSNRRPQSDLLPAIFWMLLYASLVLITIAMLALRGFVELLLIAIPAIPVFALHLWMVSQRSERGQMGIELLGSGVLALAAPAAYWVSGGSNSSEAWIIWGLTWLQSAASIVLIYLRLHQRKLPVPPAWVERWRAGSRALLYHIFNLALSIVLASFHLVPLGIPLAFFLMLLDVLEGILHPPIGAKPTAIGLRQLGSSTLFIIIVAFAYLS